MSKTTKTARKLTDVDTLEFVQTWNDTIGKDGSGSITDVRKALGIEAKNDDEAAKVNAAMSQKASNLRKQFKANAKAVAQGLDLYRPKHRGRKAGVKIQGVVDALCK